MDYSQPRWTPDGQTYKDHTAHRCNELAVQVSRQEIYRVSETDKCTHTIARDHVLTKLENKKTWTTLAVLTGEGTTQRSYVIETEKGETVTIAGEYKTPQRPTRHSGEPKTQITQSKSGPWWTVQNPVCWFVQKKFKHGSCLLYDNNWWFLCLLFWKENKTAEENSYSFERYKPLF